MAAQSAPVLDSPTEIPAPTAEDLELHLAGIASSEAFARSSSLRDLLAYLLHHRGQEVNEYSIAVEALRRKDDFDPRIDATVRVQIARLRKKLKEYYLLEGRDTGIRLHVPLGGHQIIVETVPDTWESVRFDVPEKAEEVSPIASGRQFSWKPWLWPTMAMFFALTSVCLIVLLRQSKSAEPKRDTMILPLFWNEVLGNGKDTRLVIPNPIFFQWNTPSDIALMMRDTSINEYGDFQKSEEMQSFAKQFGKPALAQSYVVATDAESSGRLTHYLGQRSVNIESTSTSEIEADQLEHVNLVLIGTYGTLAPFHTQFDPLHFRFSPYERSVLNANPPNGQPDHFDLVQESPTRMRVPGIIAYVPGATRDTHTLILAGARTAALVSYLTSEKGLQQLDSERKRNHATGYFEAVVMSEIEGNHYLRSQVMALRPYRP